jgi:hypothetical protein
LRVGVTGSMYAIDLDIPRQLEGNAHDGWALDWEPEARQVLETLRSDAMPSTARRDGGKGSRVPLNVRAQKKPSPCKGYRLPA